MTSTDGSTPTTWEFCASVSETFELLHFARWLGVRVQMTSVPLERNGPHAPCRRSVASAGGHADLDGYFVQISCEDAPELAKRLQAEIEATVRPCLITRTAAGSGPVADAV